MNSSEITKSMSADSPAISWPMLCRVRLAIHDLQACQSLVLQGRQVCFAALVDAQEMVREAIELAKQEMKGTAQ